MAHFQTSADVPLLMSSFEHLKYNTAGKSGVVCSIDHERIIKVYWETNDADAESRAY